MIVRITMITVTNTTRYFFECGNQVEINVKLLLKKSLFRLEVVTVNNIVNNF